MTFSNLCNEIFWKSTTDYHVTDSVDAPMNNPYELKTIEYYLYLKNWIDAVQWHFEDIIRDPQIDPVEALALKRRIDKSNQDRTDLVELIDSYFLDKYKAVKPLSDATINTESPAWAIDRLSILALKIYHMKQEVERTDTTEEHREQCRTKLNILLEQQKDLSSAIEQLLADIEAGRKYMKVYKQMKMYNDPALNPVLYAKKITNGAYSHYPFFSPWRCSHDNTCDTFACCAISTARNHCIKSCRMATSFSKFA